MPSQNLSQASTNDCLHLSETIRKACIDAALEAYEHAGMSGLCHEGRWECAIGAIKQLDVRSILKDHHPESEE